MYYIADQILSAEMSVTIASTTLYELNKAVDDLQDGLSPPDLSVGVADNGDQSGPGVKATELEEWNFHLQLVLDVISKAPVLVLYRPHSYITTAEGNCPPPSSSSSTPTPTSTLSPTLRLGYFTSLSHLEISRVPIHSIQDLLKMRERLRTLVVVNCHASNFRLQDVLEMCDQEVSVPMQWAVLQHLCVRNNHLSELDGSLRLCPRLELLDLSRNCLPQTDMYLGYLMELTHLDLSHNHLSVLPSVSATAKKKLRVLRLAGNKIGSLSGVEEMTSLQELDVSENLLSSHLSLHPVKGLHRLDRLNLRGCPVSMKRDHRVLSLQFISTVSLSRKFFLDDHYVSHKEIQNSRAVINYSDNLRPRQQSIQPAPRPRYDDSDQSVSQSRPTSAAEDQIAVGSSARKKKGRRKAKARMMDIPDFEASGGDFSSRDVTPSTTPRATSRMETLAQLRRQEVQETRAEMEHLRRCYGDNWLQAVEDQGLLPYPASCVVNSDADSANKSQTLRKSGTDVDIAVASQEKVTVDVHAGGPGTGGIDDSETSDRGCGGKGRESEQDRESGERVFKRDDLFLSSSSGAEDGGASDIPSPRTSAVLSAQGGDSGVAKDRMTEGGDSAVGVEEEGVREGVDGDGGGEKSPASPLSYRAQDSVQEPEEQSEPFIVTLPGHHDDPFIITLSPRYLVEKDVNGIMKDKLDLQSLTAVRTEEEEVYQSERSVDRDPQGVKVILEFSSIRKDRKCRVYIMADCDDAKHLCHLVQPFVDVKVEAARRKLAVMYQCLKCSSQFQRGEATSIVYRESIPHTGSIRDFESMTSVGGEKKERLQCPKCGSDHIVSMEDTDSPHSPPVTTSLSSSLPSDGGGFLQSASLLRKQSIDQLMRSQTPKAHSTPKKEDEGVCDSPLTRSLEQRGSRSWASRGVLTTEDNDDHRQTGDGQNPSSAVRVLDWSASLSSKLEDDAVPSRRRSNAFSDQPAPTEGRRRSDAIVSPLEFLERRTSSSVTSRDMEGTRLSTAGSVTSADAVDTSHLATFGALNNPHLSASSNSSDGTPARTGGSSVDSDITILNKQRDSVTSAVTLPPAATSDISVSHIDSRPDDDSSSSNSRADVSESQHQVSKARGDSDSSVASNVDSWKTARGALTPVQQEGEESVEGSPVGSPLSQSILSSMVSSVYNNSLLPNASSSDVYVSANEFSATNAEGGNVVSESDGELEASIYDQAAAVPPSVRRSYHKPSVSSEVEVLSVEEDVGPTQGDGSISVCEENTTATTLLSDDSAVTDTRDDDTDGTTLMRVANDNGEESYDLRHLDHRLALHLMMSVFDNSEEFKFKVETCVSQYMMLDEYQALVVITNLKLYILRVNTNDTSVELSEGLTLMEAQPHAELRRLDVGLGRQTLRLEYVSDCSSYTLVMRDTAKVDLFLELLSDQLQAYSVETGVPVAVAVNEGADQLTLDTLSADVLDKGGNSPQSLRLYCLGYIARGHNPRYPITLVVSSSEVCVVNTNHQWPSPRHQTAVTVESVGKQFTVLERQKINNIATLEVNDSDPRQLRVTFFNETSGDETRWVVSMETRKGVKDIVEAVREPWEEEFGVQLDVECSTFDSSY
ncbi:uncharacterized protein LOC143276620 isoform X2 [Babylonia areolata]|uniref:uncharacterized protein LOC143276620 isoform X2 n=1 Tax=Babylonia areolata TaxID=304850 RepID=UPI003FD49215